MKRLEGIRSSLVGVAAALGVALFLISLHGCDRPAAPVLELPSTVAVIARPRPTHANVGAASLRGPAPVEPNAVIVGDIDGDTVIVDIGGRSEHLRLLGIDTPETHRPGTPIECYGPEASAFTAALLPPGTPVRVTRDVEARDRYGRLLGQLQRAGDGLWIDEALVRSGMAAAKHYAPNFAGADALAAAETEARSRRLGIWGVCGGPHEEASATADPVA